MDGIVALRTSDRFDDDSFKILSFVSTIRVKTSDTMS